MCRTDFSGKNCVLVFRALGSLKGTDEKKTGTPLGAMQRERWVLAGVGMGL